MKPALQAKLLHVLQDAEFTKLGSNKPINVDVRVVAATNRDLEQMMVSGQFREDLYYRLKVIEAFVPPLRERRDEILPLADFFITRYSQRYKKPARNVSRELRQMFTIYDWPGNVRELENMIKRFVILQDEQLVMRELTKPRPTLAPAPAPAAPVATPTAVPCVAASTPGAPPGAVEDDEADEDSHEAAPSAAQDGRRLADVARDAAVAAERIVISDTLRDVRWNRRKAAEILGVSYKTLLNKIKEIGIERG